MENFELTAEYAGKLDEQDGLRSFRERFYIPRHNGSDTVYLTGNSLGLQPKNARSFVEQEFLDWQLLGVEGHTDAKNPWLYYHHLLSGQSAAIVGAKPSEVVVMNSLTANLHLMMVSFYRPDSSRFKIMIEGGAFPSDQYAVDSQVRFHGFEPEEAVIELQPRKGEHTLRTEDILNKIEAHGNELALVLLGGVNYYTGQAYDMEAITSKAHEAGSVCGFDLAHAAGNIPLELHRWNVDFAVWCTYKYLNSGPGGAAGVFVHERHENNPGLPRFAGWWGHREDERFLMKRSFRPMTGAQGWQLSNAQIFPMAVHRASLDIFSEAGGMEKLRTKSRKLTAYLEFALANTGSAFSFTVITPSNPEERGCQLSVLVKENGRALYEFLKQHGVIVDWREPDVIRMAPVPLYNSFSDLYRLSEIIGKFS
jgi:kynureninase